MTPDVGTLEPTAGAFAVGQIPDAVPAAVPAAVGATSGFAVNPDLADTDAEGRPELPEGVFWEGQELPGTRIELFRVNGKVYTVPAAVDPRISFRFLRSLRKRTNQEMAMADMMYEVLGEAVIDALADEDLAPDELDQVMKAVQKYSMSALQRAGLGNS